MTIRTCRNCGHTHDCLGGDEDEVIGGTRGNSASEDAAAREVNISWGRWRVLKALEHATLERPMSGWDIGKFWDEPAYTLMPRMKSIRDIPDPYVILVDEIRCPNGHSPSGRYAPNETLQQRYMLSLRGRLFIQTNGPPPRRGRK